MSQNFAVVLELLTFQFLNRAGFLYKLQTCSWLNTNTNLYVRVILLPDITGHQTNLKV